MRCQSIGRRTLASSRRDRPCSDTRRVALARFASRVPPPTPPPTRRPSGTTPAPKLPHVDGRRQFSDVPDSLSSGERLVTDEAVADFGAARRARARAPDQGWKPPFPPPVRGFRVQRHRQRDGLRALRPEEEPRRARATPPARERASVRRPDRHEPNLRGRRREPPRRGRRRRFPRPQLRMPHHGTWKRGLGAALLKKPRNSSDSCAASPTAFLFR